MPIRLIYLRYIKRKRTLGSTNLSCFITKSISAANRVIGAKLAGSGQERPPPANLVKIESRALRDKRQCSKQRELQGQI